MITFLLNLDLGRVEMPCWKVRPWIHASHTGEIFIAVLREVNMFADRWDLALGHRVRGRLLDPSRTTLTGRYYYPAHVRSGRSGGVKGPLTGKRCSVLLDSCACVTYAYHTDQVE